jgi:hypothetical protein
MDAGLLRIIRRQDEGGGGRSWLPPIVWRRSRFFFLTGPAGPRQIFWQAEEANKYLRPDIFRPLPRVSAPRVKAPARRRKRGGLPSTLLIHSLIVGLPCPSFILPSVHLFAAVHPEAEPNLGALSISFARAV